MLFTYKWISLITFFQEGLTLDLSPRAYAYDLGPKPARAILLCPLKRHLTTLSLLGGLGKQF